ncbi:Hsp20 family protein [Tepidamorphus sp. 3E244]|uniref:Hsp20 family protein n=1 Tax=Tepidamorphus sp. 3E244 TaxID=3385498 RepID=UPI0038FD26BE
MSRFTSFNGQFPLGFEDIEALLEQVSARSASNGYPPYNIERVPARKGQEERLRIVLAVAGFSADDLDVTVEQSRLTISGRQSEATRRDYLHRGIASRQFQRSFMLADGMEVSGAALDNGLLTVTLTKPEETTAVRRIKIDAPRTAT